MPPPTASPVGTPAVTRRPGYQLDAPVITLTEIGAVIAELCEPNPDWLVVGLDVMAATGMLLATLRFHRHHTTPTDQPQLPTSITHPPRYRP